MIAHYLFGPARNWTIRHVPLLGNQVAYQLRHNGLIACPFEWEQKPVICWLRLFHDPAGEPEWVAVVTEVPGNPGGSISNRHSTVQAALVNQFGVDLGSIALFHAWPRGLFGDKVLWSKVDRGGRARDGDASRADVERLVRQSLPDLPEHQELYRRVLDLGGGTWDEEFRRVFEALPVTELPPRTTQPAAPTTRASTRSLPGSLRVTTGWKGTWRLAGFSWSSSGQRIWPGAVTTATTGVPSRTRASGSWKRAVTGPTPMTT